MRLPSRTPHLQARRGSRCPLSGASAGLLAGLLLLGCGSTARPTALPSPVVLLAAAPATADPLPSSVALPSAAAATATPLPSPTSLPTAASATLPPDSLPEAGLGPFRSVDGGPEGAVSDLYVSPDGTVWLSTDEALGSLSAGRWTVHPGLPGEMVGVDRAGYTWWIAESGEAISAWDGAAWQDYGADAGWTPVGRIEDGGPWRRFGDGVVTDRRGWVWLATGPDVRAFDGQRWTVHKGEAIGFVHPPEMVEEGVSDFWLTDVVVDAHGDPWVGECTWMGPGPAGRGARRLDGKTWQAVEPSAGGAGCVNDMEVDPAGRVWLGLDGELWRGDPDGTWQQIPHPAVQADADLRWGPIYALALDPDGAPWVTIQRCGGASCDTGQLALFRAAADPWTHVLEMGDSPPVDLAFDAQGNAWLCTDQGLFRVAGGEPEEAIGEEAAHCLVEADAAGRLWLAVPGRPGLWVAEPTP